MVICFQTLLSNICFLLCLAQALKYEIFLSIHTKVVTQHFHFDVFTLMGECGLRRGLQGLCADSDLKDATRKGSLVGRESLVPPPSKEKQTELFDLILFRLSARVKCSYRDEGKTCHCVLF